MAARQYAPDAEHYIVVASTVSPVIRAALKAAGQRITLEDPLEEPFIHQSRWVNQLTKLKLWTRTTYDMVCHMDGDVIFATNISEVRQQRHVYGHGEGTSVNA